MRGVARWLKVEEDEEEEETVEDIDSDDDDEEFIDGVKKLNEKAKSKNSKSKRKKSHEDKGQLSMSFFVQRDDSSERKTTRSESTKEVGNVDIESKQTELQTNDTSVQIDDRTCENRTDCDITRLNGNSPKNLIHCDKESTNVTMKIAQNNGQTLSQTSATAQILDNVQDSDLNAQETDNRAAKSESPVAVDMENSTTPETQKIKAISIVQNVNIVAHINPTQDKAQVYTPSGVAEVEIASFGATKRKTTESNEIVDTCSSTRKRVKEVDLIDVTSPTPAINPFPRLTASGRPKRKAVMNSEARGEKEIPIESKPSRRQPGKKAAKTLKENDDENDCILIETKPVSKGKAKKSSAPAFFLTPNEKDSLRRQEAALVEEQRQVEAMLQFQKDLDRRKALDVSFFAGHKVNPFFQQVKATDGRKSADSSVDSIDGIESTNVSLWKKEIATYFPLPSHVNAPKQLSTCKALGFPPSASPTPVIVSLEGEFNWKVFRSYQQVDVILEAARNESFWIARHTNTVIDLAAKSPAPTTHAWHNYFEHKLNTPLLVDRYAPRAARALVGNKASVNLLNEWLRAWKMAREGLSLRRIAEEYPELFASNCDSDDEELEPSEALLHVFVIQGECGAGKTSSVYACAQDLGYEVLEINASQPRSGKNLMELAGEATQSDRVVKTIHILDSTTPSTAPGKQKKSKKKRQEPLSTTSLTLVLLEDVDQLFDSDKGFMTALQQMAKNTRCPIVVTCTDFPENFPPTLQQVGRIFSRPSSKEFTSYLNAIIGDQPKLACCETMDTMRMYNIFHGDVRRALHYLQLHGPPLPCVSHGTNAESSSSIDAVPKEIAIFAANDGDGRDVLHSSYLHELKTEFPTTPGKDADDQIKKTFLDELERMERISDTIAACDVWTNSKSTRGIHNYDRHSELVQGTRLVACRTMFSSRSLPHTNQDHCIELTMETSKRQKDCLHRMTCLHDCVAAIDMNLTPYKGCTVSMLGTSGYLDTIPMLSKISMIDGSTQLFKRRSSSRHSYLNKILTDGNVIKMLEETSYYGQKSILL